MTDSRDVDAARPADVNVDRPSPAIAKTGIVGDVPLADPDADRLGRAQLARRLAEVITARRDPSSVVFGIYGSWGQGKSTFLNYVERYLREGKTLCLRFNPWLVGEESDLFKTFFAEVAQVLEFPLSTKGEQAGDLARKYSWLTSLASGGIFDLEKAANSLGPQASLDQLKQRVATALEGKGTRLVVFMDDIDRLSRREVHLIFRLIKVAADFRHTTYILAMDHDMVAAAVAEQYGAGDVRAGRDYLEKIVQIPLDLPEPDPVEIQDMCLEGVQAALEASGVTLAQDQQLEFMRAFRSCIGPSLKTPRTARRYANTVEIALGVLRDEVHPVDQLLVEGMRVLFPQVYELACEYPEMFLGTSDWRGLLREREQQLRQERKERFDEALAAHDEQEKVAARELVEKLFPKAREFLGGIGVRLNEEVQFLEKRVSSGDYFERYFSYCIRRGDVSDQRVASFMSALVDRGLDELVAALRGLARPENARVLLNKIALRAQEIPRSSSKKLALALAAVGDCFPGTDGVFGLSSSSTRAFAGEFVARMSWRIASGSDRDPPDTAFLNDLAGSAQPVTLAMEILRSLRGEAARDFELNGRQGDPDESPIVVQVGRVVAQRIEASSRESDLFVEFRSDLNPLLYYWERFGPGNGASDYVQARISEDPLNAVALLVAFGGAHLDGSNLAVVRRLVDPNRVKEALDVCISKASGPGERLPLEGLLQHWVGVTGRVSAPPQITDTAEPPSN